MTPRPKLKQIHLHTLSKTVDLLFANEEKFTLSAEFLRVHSPSAEVQGHFGKGGVTPFGKKEVGICALQPVGHYGVRIDFDDGHQSGYYRWGYFYELAIKQALLWETYLKKLNAAGQLREKETSIVRFISK